MVKIHISYEKDGQEEKVLRLLRPLIKGCRVRRAEKSGYKHLYIKVG